MLLRQKIAPATAENDFDTVNPALAVISTCIVALIQLDQLSGDVLAVANFAHGIGVGIAFKIALGRFGVSGGWCGVGDSGGADHAGGHTGQLGVFQRRHQLRSAGADTARGFRTHADDAGIGFDAGHHRTHGAGGIGHLLVDVVGLHQRAVRQALEFKLMLFTAVPEFLPGVNARCCYRGRTHAVTDKQNDVFCRAMRIEQRLQHLLAIGHRCGGTALVPVGAGFGHRGWQWCLLWLCRGNAAGKTHADNNNGEETGWT